MAYRKQKTVAVSESIDDNSVKRDRRSTIDPRLGHDLEHIRQKAKKNSDSEINSFREENDDDDDEKLPVIPQKFKKVNLDEKDTQCSICYEFMMQPIKFKCKHRFCIKCIKDLVSSSKSDTIKKVCPKCRGKIKDKLI